MFIHKNALQRNFLNIMRFTIVLFAVFTRSKCQDSWFFKTFTSLVTLNVQLDAYALCVLPGDIWPITDCGKAYGLTGCKRLNKQFKKMPSGSLRRMLISWRKCLRYYVSLPHICRTFVVHSPNIRILEY